LLCYDCYLYFMSLRELNNSNSLGATLSRDLSPTKRELLENIMSGNSGQVHRSTIFLFSFVFSRVLQVLVFRIKGLLDSKTWFLDNKILCLFDSPTLSYQGDRSLPGRKEVNTSPPSEVLFGLSYDSTPCQYVSKNKCCAFWSKL
jgi:hypothetical protein